MGVVGSSLGSKIKDPKSPTLSLIDQIEQDGSRHIHTFDIFKADIQYANIIADKNYEKIGVHLSFALIANSFSDKKILNDIMWAVNPNITLSIILKKVSQGFIEFPYLIPKSITVKQFYSIYSLLSEMYKKTSTSPRHSLTSDSSSLLYGSSPSSKSSSPLVRIKSAAIDDDEDADRECKICMENEIEVILKCNHVFCQRCFNEWQTKNDSCAMCRQLLIDEKPDKTDTTSAMEIKESNMKLPSSLEAKTLDIPTVMEDENAKRQSIVIQNLKLYVMSLGKIALIVKPPPPQLTRSASSPIRNAVENANRRQSATQRVRSVRLQNQRLNEAPWICTTCTFEGNPGNRSRCQICNTSRHTAILRALLSDLEVLEQRRASVAAGRRGGAGLGGGEGVNLSSLLPPPAVEGGLDRNNNTANLVERWNDIDFQLALLLSMQVDADE